MAKKFENMSPAELKAARWEMDNLIEANGYLYPIIKKKL